MNKRIVVLDDYENSYAQLSNWSTIQQKADVTFYKEPLPSSELLPAIQSAHCLVLMRDRTPLTADLIAQLPQLEYVVFTGTRNLALDTEALRTRQIPISHTEWGPSKDSTAELTWALILSASKRVVEQSELLRQQEWRNAHSLLPVLRGKTLGLIGLGEIGSRVAKVANAFGMRVLAWSPHMTAERAQAAQAEFKSLETLLCESDIVSLHIVAGPTTKGMINKERLAMMKPTAWLVNTSRSTLIDTPALIERLHQGHLAGAALDVFDQEPLPQNHPLRQTPNTLLTPHLGFVARPVFESFTQGVVECLEAWLDGKPIVRPLP